MKRFIAIILALVFMFSLSVTALAAGGSTNVSITVNSSQISVTVPTALAFEVKVDGGLATLTTEGTYKITNSSSIPIKVDTIAVAFKNGITNWTFKDSAFTTEGTAPANSSVNEIYLSVNSMVLDECDAAAPTNKTAWNIAANSDLTLALACSTSKLNTTEDVDDLITITYVISAGTHLA